MAMMTAMADSDQDLFTENDIKLSHLVEAIEIATTSPMCRGLIMQKLVKHAFGGAEKVPFSLEDLYFKLLEGDDAGEWINQITVAFGAMRKTEW